MGTQLDEHDKLLCVGYATPPVPGVVKVAAEVGRRWKLFSDLTSGGRQEHWSADQPLTVSAWMICPHQSEVIIITAQRLEVALGLGGGGKCPS